MNILDCLLWEVLEDDDGFNKFLELKDFFKKERNLFDQANFGVKHLKWMTFKTPILGFSNKDHLLIKNVTSIIFSFV